MTSQLAIFVRFLLFAGAYLVGTVTLVGQAPTTETTAVPDRRELTPKTKSLMLTYQGFEVNKNVVRPTGGARNGLLPDYDTIISQLWGESFDFEDGDKDTDGSLTEVELLDLLLEQSLSNEEARAWTTLLIRGGDVNKNQLISRSELMVLHYAPLIERHLRQGFGADDSTHVQISFEDESLTEFANTFAYFVATLRVDGYPTAETDILSLDRKIEIEPLYFDHTLLPNLTNKAAFNLTNQSVSADGKTVAMGINLCLFELNCIVRLGRFDNNEDLALSKREWILARGVMFPEDEDLLSMRAGDRTIGLTNGDREPTFEILDTNANDLITIAEIMHFLRESMADFGDLKL